MHHRYAIGMRLLSPGPPTLFSGAGLSAAKERRLEIRLWFDPCFFCPTPIVLGTSRRGPATRR